MIQRDSCLLTTRDYYRFMLCLTPIIFYSQTLLIRPIFIFLLLVLVSRSYLPDVFISPSFRFDVNTLNFQLSSVFYYSVHSSLKRLTVTGRFGNSDITLNVRAEELCWNTECPHYVSVLFSVTMINSWLLSPLRPRYVPFRLFITLFINSPIFQSCIV
jgi:hypothetical protein